MPSPKIELKCQNNHRLYLAYYRNSNTLKRIKNLLYCPGCNEFYKYGSDKVTVKIVQ